MKDALMEAEKQLQGQLCEGVHLIRAHVAGLGSIPE